MNIDYFAHTGASVLDVIKQLQSVVDANPEIDFSRIGVSLNEEHTARNVELQSWQYRGLTRFDVCID